MVGQLRLLEEVGSNGLEVEVMQSVVGDLD